MLKNLQQICLKLLQGKQFKKTTEATDDMIGNKIVDRIRKVSKSSQQNNIVTVTNDHDKEIPKKRYVSPEESQKIIDNVDINIIV